MYIYRTAVIGAGAMGAEIAQVLSYGGIPVILKDIEERFVESGLQRARAIYERRVAKGKMTSEEVQSKMALIRPTTRTEDLRDVDLVIEAVIEDLQVKKEVFRELDRICPKSTILASNTSSLSISELGAATQRPDKVIGLHFFYPPHVMKLVEIIPGLETSEGTVSDVTLFAESLRKIPIRVRECAGFLVNRLLMPYLNEAAYCLQEGSASVEEVDRAAVQFGLPMGPFTLVDTVGLDVCQSVVKVLLRDYGARMTPAPIWKVLYEAGRYGVKRKKGFYTYDGNPRVEPELAFLIGSLSPKLPKPKKKFSVERLLLPMINEAAYCLQEEISNPSDIELAMIAGLGFPPVKGGILHVADQIGIDTVVQELEEWYGELGERFWPAPHLRRMVRANHLGKKTKKGFFTYGR